MSHVININKPSLNSLKPLILSVSQVHMRKGMASATTFSLMLHFLLLILCFSFHQPSLAFTSQEYQEALEKSILFFEGQRSGKLPSNQRLTWRGDSGLSDGSSYHVNLVGGYYDAGDNVKFGLPMAFTTTLLAWSVIEFGSSMMDQIENARAAIRWSTDYLLKAATTTPDTLYVQVGDPNMDHKCWERPEDMDTPRNVYKVSAQNPGSDVAAETAAALAASSIVFGDSDPAYSSKLLQAAIKVFNFADRYRGSYSDSLGSVVCPFYCSYSGYHDELLWGASWIYKASGTSSYMQYIRSNGHILGADDDGFSFSWDDKRPGTKILLSKEFLEKNSEEFQLYKAHSDNYICSLMSGIPGSQAQYTRGGLLYKGSESNLQYVTSTSLLLLTYAKYLSANGGVVRCGTSTVTGENLVTLAKTQVDYILGDNPRKMSYMVGFGENYPKHVHHRGSSLPSVRSRTQHISCNEGFQYLYAGSPNPNELVGAIVGGPDSNDNFSDDRNNYQQSEPATYINAPFVGALAYFSAKPPTYY
ncbi:endoglucanase 1-like [Vigna umbellata]|uniref:endoglucanase 1-like n=1 Tax=Vigna umbellata TaxID=87088 RepID=UPI001F5EB491|nr:endoglucanase 1-like [Vigna umbellata]